LASNDVGKYMTYNLSDKEQVQLVKDWWKKNGKLILICLIIFLALNSLYIYYKNYQTKYREQASNAYVALINAETTNKTEEAKLFAKDLMQKYPRSIYASLGGLFLAKNAVTTGKFDDAVKDLTWVSKKAKNASFRQIAKIRAARVLLQQNKYQDALNMLEKIDDPAFNPATLEIKGDILLAMQKKSDAAAAYKTATDDSATLEKQSPLLTLKNNS
jgi:predicted negative regulator of RcsB-dependent stress response